MLLLIALIAFWRALPDPLFNAPLSVALYDRDGALLGARIASDGQWRFATPREVPDKLARAIIAFEDQRFRQHPGVDPLALARAAWLDVKARRIVSGGSTLSMQVIRLARGNPARTVGEKLIEMILALRLELSYSKDEILALYCAHAPFGGNVVGMEAAAWRYFGRAPELLSWAEAATLAVLPNSPALIHPGQGRAKLLKKRDALLQRMQARNEFAPIEHRLALAEPLPAAPRALPRFAPHLLDTLAAAQPEQASFASTLDRGLQQAAGAALAQRVQGYAAQGVHNAAALVIDNTSMQVLAYVGNAVPPAGVEAGEGRGYAVDIVRRARSTGSVLKPFLYAAMMQDGLLQPGSLVPDVPMHFTGFRPENFDHSYRGVVRAREALAQSLNVPAVYLLREYGLARFYDLLGRMGLSTLTRTPDGYGLTLILGGAEGTLWDLAALYANLARVAAAGRPRGGLRYAGLQVQQGVPAPDGTQADFGAGAAWLTLEALQDVNRPELDAHWRTFASSRPLAWKTGTSYGLRDGWAIGVTPRYTAAVWIGNAGGEGRAGLTGAGMAAPLLFDLVNRLDDRSRFAVPHYDLREVRVCRDDGYLPQAGCDTELAKVPAGSHYRHASPYHVQVHLDAGQRHRVHGRCERVGAMVHRSWFVLPPAQEHFFRTRNSAYRSLPPYRADCREWLAADGAQRPFDIVYPEPATTVYIPVDLGARKGRVVFEVAHRSADATLYWHLDDEYLARTEHFHKLALDVAPGAHRITVVDEAGFRQQRSFKVLGRSQGGEVQAKAAP